ncbi:MAG: phage integrase SAM-like domain-containing protein [Alistipes sp.]|nr:phage integrase SAM-like domain-containing protein [Alistipes sp.]
MANKYNILFFLQPEKERDDRHLRCRVRWGKNMVTLNVGYRVEHDKWSRYTQRCIKSTTHGKSKTQANTINRAIDRMDSAIAAYFERCDLNDAEPTANGIRIAAGKEVAEKGFFDVFDEFIGTVSIQKSWSVALRSKMLSLRKHLHNFNPAITFKGFDDDCLYDFISYLQSVDAGQTRYVNARCGLKNTTISRMLGFLRFFLRWANTKGYYNGNLHNTFHPHLIELKYFQNCASMLF